MRQLLCVLAVLLFGAVPASAQPTLVSCSSVGTSTGADVTPVLGLHAANDVMIMLGTVRDVDDTVTVSGWTAMTGSPWSRSTVERYWVFWKRAVSAAETNPLFDKSTATGDTYAVVCVWRGVSTAASPPFDVGAATTGTSDPATCTALTTTVEDTQVVVILGYGDDNNASIITTSTDPAEYLEIWAPSATGSDGTVSYSFGNKSVAGSTGTASIDFNASVTAGDGWGCVILGIYPNSQTLGRRHRIHLLGIGL
jgi:hypothetical protein